MTVPALRNGTEINTDVIVHNRGLLSTIDRNGELYIFIYGDYNYESSSRGNFSNCIQRRMFQTWTDLLHLPLPMVEAQHPLVWSALQSAP
ncbi:hypothetical protein BGW42_004446 [Actinomortierella wolfii]|nr:hypothetical protein BGW42_004446 [Actinomortierella wolfii]